MQISELFQGDRYILLDGGMGTMLQSMGLQPGERPELLAVPQPELLGRVPTAYLEAGARVIYANPFGASPHKLEGTGYTPAQLVPAALDIARQAAAYYGSQYQIIYAVHMARDHPHIHFVMNTVSYVTGRKYPGDKADYYAYQKHLKDTLHPYGLYMMAVSDDGNRSDF